MKSHSVIINNVVKEYGNFKAVDGISLNIENGEFFTLLGPSGCGKTTLLRMIAGFNTIEDGTISFDDTVINTIPAHKRDIGMVFQNYAIFPHLNVYDNVAYGLRARKVPKDQLDQKVMQSLDLVQIKHLKDRKPNELSGGQQQRVALARAFVIEPAVLLMDEPLSNLDAKLRVQMRTVIKKLQRQLGITTIYVTHDQEEALAISDRLAVINNGKIMQVGKPKDIYANPANEFVAGFIGVSNFIDCTVQDNKIALDNYSITLPQKVTYTGKAKLSARPEQMAITEQTEGLTGTIVLSTFLGDFVQHEVQLASGQIIDVNEYTKEGAQTRETGDKVTVQITNGWSLFDEKGNLIC